MMKKTFPILPALVLLLAGACSKNSGGGGVKLRNDTDSVAYVIGMNVGANLLKMDSTINVNAVCEGIRDMFRGNPRLSAADAETFYLSYVNYALPEKARAYAYCSDTCYLPGLADRLKGVTCLYHESTYADEDEDKAQKYFHSTARQAAMVARDAGVGRLLLGHYSSKYNTEDVLLQQAKEVFAESSLTSEGMVATL